jgi:hypothetical protein
MNDEQRKEIRQQFWDEDYFDGLPNRGELLKHFINEYGKAIERQQQAEIGALKKEAALQRLSDFTQEAECKHGVDDGACKECYQESTEPVALTQVEIMNALTLGIPLYTHPVKELTDEEIHQAFRDTWDATVNPNCVFTAFARAILRKAQENET